MVSVWQETGVHLQAAFHRFRVNGVDLLLLLLMESICGYYYCIVDKILFTMMGFLCTKRCFFLKKILFQIMGFLHIKRCFFTFKIRFIEKKNRLKTHKLYQKNHNSLKNMFNYYYQKNNNFFKKY